MDRGWRRYTIQNAPSYFNLQEPEMLPKFLGATQFTSNQVLEVAEKSIRKLIKSGDPLVGLAPLIKSGGRYREQTIHFYEVSWPVKNEGAGEAARIEIDARTGEVTSLILWDLGFRDQTFAQQLSRAVPFVRRTTSMRVACTARSPSFGVIRTGRRDPYP